jgi:hypothetical protein
MATCKTNCCHSDGLKVPRTRAKVLAKTRFVTENVFLVFLISFGGLWALTWAQQYPQNPYLGDRDPRFYSRPGVTYNPPNPGDKDYR